MYRAVIQYPDGTEEESDDVFETEAEAENNGMYLCSCYSFGGEVLHGHNPGDYPPNDDKADYYVIEV